MVGTEFNQSQWESILTPCDLWVMPTPRDSRWFARMDWYLNFQMCKGLAYGGLHLPAETYAVAQEHGLPVLSREEHSHTPLLIAPSGRLPTERCVVIERTGELKEWLEKIHKLASGLKIKSLRIFLPKDCELTMAQKLWPESDEKVFFTTDLENAR